MKVILKETVPNLGKSGQVVNVKDGYARNYLFPKGLATVAERNQISALEKLNARMAAKQAESKASAESLKEKLDGVTVKIEGKVGRDHGKLFGAITSQDIVDVIKKDLKIDVEKKQVVLHDPIKRLGRTKVLVDLHREVDAHITVHVWNAAFPEFDEEVVAAAPAEAVAEEVAAEVDAPAEAEVKAEEPAEVS
ncbi:MAG: 50S ribosomal protein L9 [Chthonomonas sp.]|nr:50S ribosomal protein L9 [Chthonomonas sp.]